MYSVERDIQKQLAARYLNVKLSKIIQLNRDHEATCIEDTIIDRYSLTFMVIVGLPNLIVYVFVTLINKQTVSHMHA